LHAYVLARMLTEFFDVSHDPRPSFHEDGPAVFANPAREAHFRCLCWGDWRGNNLSQRSRGSENGHEYSDQKQTFQENLPGTAIGMSNLKPIRGGGDSAKFR